MRSLLAPLVLALALASTSAMAVESAPAYMPLRAAVVLPSGWRVTGETRHDSLNQSDTPIANASLGLTGVIHIRNDADYNRDTALQMFVKDAENLERIGASHVWYGKEGGYVGWTVAYTRGRTRTYAHFYSVPNHEDTIVTIIVTGTSDLRFQRAMQALTAVAIGIIIP